MTLPNMCADKWAKAPKIHWFVDGLIEMNKKGNKLEAHDYYELFIESSFMNESDTGRRS